MNYEMAVKTVRDYRCSVCWSGLQLVEIAQQEYICICSHYGEEHAGYHHRKFVERRGSDSMAEAMDVNHMLRQAGVIDNPHKGKTAKQLIEELGF